MKLARSKLFVNPLAMSLVCLVATFTPVLAEASAGGKIIVEILERLLKNTDEVITKSKGGVQGGAPEIVRQSLHDDRESSAYEDWRACVIAAEEQREARGLTELRELQFISPSNEESVKEAQQLASELSREFCYEMIKCNAALLPQYSTMTQDFQSCIAEQSRGN